MAREVAEDYFFRRSSLITMSAIIEAARLAIDVIRSIRDFIMSIFFSPPFHGFIIRQSTYFVKGLLNKK